MRWLAVVLWILGAASLGGCAHLGKMKPKPAVAVAPPAPAKPKSAAERAAEASGRFAAVSGNPRITIDLSAQRAYFYKGDELVTSSRVSTGKKGFGTPTGSFRITQKERTHRSTTYGKYVSASGGVVDGDVDVRKDPKPEGASFLGASMPYFMRFNGPVGMHAGNVPGYPASHGCVRLPRSTAPLFYTNAPVGTPVVVRQ